MIGRRAKGRHMIRSRHILNVCYYCIGHRDERHKGQGQRQEKKRERASKRERKRERVIERERAKEREWKIEREGERVRERGAKDRVILILSKGTVKIEACKCTLIISSGNVLDNWFMVLSLIKKIYKREQNDRAKKVFYLFLENRDDE